MLREGHLQALRQHIEDVDGIEHKLGVFLDDSRRRADKLSEEQRQELTALEVRW